MSKPAACLMPYDLMPTGFGTEFLGFPYSDTVVDDITVDLYSDFKCNQKILSPAHQCQSSHVADEPERRLVCALP